MIFCILGASNSGKTELMLEFVKAGSRRIKTITTRKPRSGESLDAYDFISRTEFERKLADGELVENVEYAGNYYGLAREEVINTDNGVIVMEPNGFRQLCELFPNMVYSIYLKVPEDERRRRAILRGDEAETTEARIKEDRNTFTQQLENEVNCILNTPQWNEYRLIAMMCHAPFLVK